MIRAGKITIFERLNTRIDINRVDLYFVAGRHPRLPSYYMYQDCCTWTYTNHNVVTSIIYNKLFGAMIVVVRILVVRQLL